MESRCWISNDHLTTTPPIEQTERYRWTWSNGNDLVMNNAEHRNGIPLPGNWNNLTSNKANDNAFSGIDLTNSNWNTLFNNTANSNTQNGIC